MKPTPTPPERGHNPKEEKCDCKKMTCLEDCSKNHTHKTFWCEKCSPEKYESSQPKEVREEKHDCAEDPFGECYTCGRFMVASPSTEESTCTEGGETPWQVEFDEKFQDRLGFHHPEELVEIKSFLSSRLAEAQENGKNAYILSPEFKSLLHKQYEFGFHVGLTEGSPDYTLAINKARTAEREWFKGVVEGMRKASIGFDQYGTELYPVGTGDKHYNTAVDDLLTALSDRDLLA